MAGEGGERTPPILRAISAREAKKRRMEPLQTVLSSAVEFEVVPAAKAAPPPPYHPQCSSIPLFFPSSSERPLFGGAPLSLSLPFPL